MQFREYMISTEYSVFCYLIFHYIAITYAFIGPNVKPASDGEFPFIVGIVKKRINIYGNRDLVCTATLITKQDILTADHCFSGEICEGVEVVVGSIDITSTPNNGLIWWLSYETWASNTGKTYDFFENDISIARLKQTVSKDMKIAKLKYMSWEELQGKYATTAGWGKTEMLYWPTILHKTKLKILSKSECENRLSQQCGGKKFGFRPNHLCSVGKPHAVLMVGDSGSPLLYHNSIVAVNWGSTPITDDEHFYPDKLNMHINVYFYRDYIKSVVNIK